LSLRWIGLDVNHNINQPAIPITSISDQSAGYHLLLAPQELGNRLATARLAQPVWMRLSVKYS